MMLAREQPTAAALAAESEMDPATAGLQRASALTTRTVKAARATKEAGAPQGAPLSSAGEDISKKCAGAAAGVGAGNGARTEGTYPALPEKESQLAALALREKPSQREDVFPEGVMVSDESTCAGVANTTQLL